MQPLTWAHGKMVGRARALDRWTLDFLKEADPSRVGGWVGAVETPGLHPGVVDIKGVGATLADLTHLPRGGRTLANLVRP